MVRESVDDLIKEIVDKNDEHWSAWRETPLWYWVLCLSGEAGELGNMTKKLYRSSWGWGGNKMTHSEFQREAGLELGDIFVYWVLTLEQMGLDPAEIIRKTLKKNYERFGWE
jgi:NTP pyrophosphatase (non-canonical NTP hydrolase)